MRSPYSVIGGRSGTDSDETVMPGSTSAPTTQPWDPEFPGHAVYRVVGVMSQTLPAPFGGLLLVVPLGPEMPASAYCAAVPNKYPGRLWSEKLNCTPYFNGTDPAILSCVRNGMPLLV